MSGSGGGVGVCSANYTQAASKDNQERANYSIFAGLRSLFLALLRNTIYPLIWPFQNFFLTFGFKNWENPEIRKYIIKDSIESVQKIRRRIYLTSVEKAKIACGVVTLYQLTGKLSDYVADNKEQDKKFDTKMAQIQIPNATATWANSPNIWLKQPSNLTQTSNKKIKSTK